MRKEYVALLSVLLGILALPILLLVGSASAGPPTQEPGDDETQAVADDGAWHQDGSTDDGGALALVDDGFWYQGRLTDGDGNPLANTYVNAIFRIYDVSSGGMALDSVVVTVNTDENGLFNEEIDFNNPNLFNGQALYLGMQVSGEVSEMAPRQCLRPVPYALSIRPGAVIGGEIVLGHLGEDGYLYVHDSDDIQVMGLSGASGYLRLGGVGEDGDIIVSNAGLTTTFQIDGATGNMYVYDGVGDTSAHRLFEFDSTFVPSTPENHSTGAIWGDQSHNLGNLSLMSNDDVDVYLEQTGPGTTAGQFRVYNGAGTVVFRVSEDGDVWAAGDADLDQGTKSAIVQTQAYGRRKLYCMESPEIWFEDFGTAQLVNGQATVTIEPLFLQTINTGVPYHVFVTPLGDCNSLYVTNKAATTFEVRELGGGTANIEFDYRIAAKRLGFEDLRLEPPEPPGTEVPGTGGRANASEPIDEAEPPQGEK